MRCAELADTIERIQPAASAQDVARLCLLLTNSVARLDELSDDARLTSAWREMGLRMQAATDQHTAMTEELGSLSGDEPDRLTTEQVLVLIRAIKVQSQLLQMYVGQPVLDV